jgi:hypothetical protein
MPIASLRRFMPAALLACASPSGRPRRHLLESGVVDAEKRVTEEADRLEEEGRVLQGSNSATSFARAVQKELAGWDAAAAVLKHKDTIRHPGRRSEGHGPRRQAFANVGRIALADDVRTAFENRVGRTWPGPVCDIFIDNVLDG